MSVVNEKQVGGEHYKADYQHWDWVTDIGLEYLEGCATKYVLRWRQKNGVQDLEKAQHYVEKVMSLVMDPRGWHNDASPKQELYEQMLASYPHPVDDMSKLIILQLSDWCDINHLHEIHQNLAQLIDEAKEEARDRG